MSESPANHRVATKSQPVIDSAKRAVEMNQDQLERLQAKRDERRERMQTLERVLSYQPPSGENSE